MRVTVPHFFDFGSERARVGDELADADSWDALRSTSGPFALAASRLEWEEGIPPDIRARARDIVSLADRLGAQRLCSYGVGAGRLELAVAQADAELELTCTDFAPQTVDRLQSLFPEATVVRHDLVAEGPLAADFHLLHRIDTEFSNATLQAILGRFSEPVLLVPALLLVPRVIARELYLRLARVRATRAGWVRTKSALRDLWAPTHTDTEVRVGDGTGFLLERRADA